jgi:hypothetical protein
MTTDLSERLRGTGLTTRMLKAAIVNAKMGRAVYVVAANRSELTRLKVLLILMGGANLGIQIETPDSMLKELHAYDPRRIPAKRKGPPV